jgi:hypothetical protein
MGLNCTKIRQLRVVLHRWRQITKRNGELISPLLRNSIFLGYKRWYKGLKNKAKEPYEVLNDWDALYQGEAKLPVTKMVMLVQSMGLIITRKARGGGVVQPTTCIVTIK